MADQEFKGEEKARFPALLIAGLALLVVVIVVAFVVDSEIGIPVLILTVIVALAAVGYRLVAGSNRQADTDSTDSGLPKAGSDDSRPLGDTEQAHDEINPHDLPKSHPGREEAEREAGDEGTTRGPVM